MLTSLGLSFLLCEAGTMAVSPSRGASLSPFCCSDSVHIDPCSEWAPPILGLGWRAGCSDITRVKQNVRPGQRRHVAFENKPILIVSVLKCLSIIVSIIGMVEFCLFTIFLSAVSEFYFCIHPLLPSFGLSESFLKFHFKLTIAFFFLAAQPIVIYILKTRLA